MLAHLMYAGAYAYDRRRQQKRPSGRARRRWLPAEQWHVLIRDHFSAYISWARHEANLQQMRHNRSRFETRGTVRRGRALLAGLITCGHCGCRMFTRYAGQASRPRYICEVKKVAYADPACQGLAAAGKSNDWLLTLPLNRDRVLCEFSLAWLHSGKGKHDGSNASHAGSACNAPGDPAPAAAFSSPNQA